MYSLSLRDILLLMAASLFFLGMATLILGVFVLVTRSMGRDMRTLTAQTTQLAQKGITEDIAGLVGNASALLSAMTQLVRTAAGIGIFLVLLGLALMGSAYWLITQINWNM